MLCLGISWLPWESMLKMTGVQFSVYDSHLFFEKGMQEGITS